MDESTKLGSPQRDYKTLSHKKHHNEDVQSSDFDDLDLKPEVINTKDIEKMPQSVENEELGLPNLATTGKKKKVPKRVIHFSDGVVEEFSTDSEEEEEKRKAEELEKEEKKKALIDPKTLRWLPWMLYYTWFMGSSALSYCDFVGEKLAWWFGITSPKYYYELQEFERMKEEEEEEEKRRQVDEYGWSNVSSPEVLTNPNTGQNPSAQPNIELEGLSPKNLQRSSDLQEHSVNTKTTMEQELHTVDFDPESQTKHY